MEKRKNMDNDLFLSKRSKDQPADESFTATLWDSLRNIKSDYYKKYVTGTDVKNHLLNDPILDWLNVYYNKKNIIAVSNNKISNNINVPTDILVDSTIDKPDIIEDSLTDKPDILIDSPASKFSSSDNEPNKTTDEFLLFKNGNLFEKQIFNKLKNLFGDKFILIAESGRNSFNETNCLKTIEEINKGTPIIAQAVLCNDKNGTGGIADLLVRSDYINKIVKKTVLYEEETTIKASNLNGNYHYRSIIRAWDP